MVDQVSLAGRVSRAVCAVLVLAFALALGSAHRADAASPVFLGSADSFALLGGSTITNTGSTTISGDIGLCCSGIATTGFTPGANQVIQPAGAQFIGTGGVAATAQNDLDAAYTNAAGQAVTNTVAVDLSLTGTPANPLLPGVYQSIAHGALQINTGLTLDFQGDPNAVFIFQGTTLTTAVGAGGSVRIVNGGATPSTCNIYWQLSDPTQGVTLGTASEFKGTTMALGASVLGTGATVEGRILTRRSKAVNLDTNTITRSACFSAVAVGATLPTVPASGGSPAPSPAAAVSPGSPTLTVTPTHTPTPAPSGPATTTGTPSGPASPTGSGSTGSAHLSGPNGTVSGPFTVAVTGHAISHVTFSIDNRPMGTVHAKRGRKKFMISFNPRGRIDRVHHIVARITFTARSRTPRTTRRLTFRRSDVPPRAPRFTG